MGGRQSKYWLPWLVGMPAETATAIVSVLMGGILEQFPKLRFCFAHGGGSFPFTIGRIEHGYQVRFFQNNLFNFSKIVIFYTILENSTVGQKIKKSPGQKNL